ncbi:MAG: hypothetical protein CMJ46_11045 [Planctomyces sp.]|nr:hypothetical protein [Planctomyces sp.]
MIRTATLVAVTLFAALTCFVADPTVAAEKESKRVKPQVFLEYDKLPAGGKCRVMMEIQIEESWHINANKPGIEDLIPTTFTVKSEQGVKLTDIKYPKHELINMEGVGTVNVYEGKIRIYGTLEVPASAAQSVDKLQLTVNYQACTEKFCERPDKATIEGKIPVAASINDVKKKNEELFK